MGMIPEHLVLFEGKMTQFSYEIGKDRFKLTADSKIGTIMPIFGALAGLGAMAASAVMFSKGEMPAHYVRLKLENGDRFEGWLWCASIFRVGDEVRLVATPEVEDGTRYLVALTRPKDYHITTYPFCRMGTKYLKKDEIKMFPIMGLLSFFFFFSFFLFFFFIEDTDLSDLLWSIPDVVGFSLVVSLCITLKALFENTPYAQLSNKIFATLHFKDPENTALETLDNPNIAPDGSDKHTTLCRYKASDIEG